MSNEEAEKKAHEAGDHSQCSHGHEHGHSHDHSHDQCTHDHPHDHSHDHSHDQSAGHGHSHDHGHGHGGGFVPPNSIHDHSLVAVALATLAGLIWLIGYWATYPFPTHHAASSEHQGAQAGHTAPGSEEAAPTPEGSTGGEAGQH